MAGGSFGIALGCVLGMLPLLFIDGKKGNREESPAYVDIWVGQYVTYEYTQTRTKIVPHTNNTQRDLHVAGPGRHLAPRGRAVRSRASNGTTTTTMIDRLYCPSDN